MTSRPHLLLVEDEPSIRAPLAAFLHKNGYRVSEAKDAAEARTLLPAHAIDLVILDIMMPGEDGLSLARFIRANGDLPIIMLTAMTEDTDKIVGLEMGADDYLAKPFNPRELLARIRAILRRSAQGGRSGAEASPGTKYLFEGFAFDIESRQLTGPDGEAIPLTTGEYDLLKVLVTRPGRVLSRDQLLDLTRGREAHAFDRAVDNTVSRLRKKIEDDPKTPRLIQTVHGAGYTFACTPERV
ncbi:DNA-binding response regulator [Pacificimonas flava]|uniref:Regulatory protein VirG n=2 Tax=Pacificimonas TaxID=1960290 RepID=A0A219B8P8_9SPHN|nr:MULTISPECIES: response regulator [Pacificimonas]MBZ6379988.1 response regulator [Pacificimonas aurantium]OWV34506.1 DNA-binding response regulator [Pacificimonas flava]